MSSHESNVGDTDDWITPRYIIDALPRFDLDPCASAHQAWDTANKMIRLPDDGLTAEWRGSVWLNPPYGRVIAQWMKRLAMHGNGVALIFARTESLWFHEWVWPYASGVFFFRRRLSFVHSRPMSERQKSGSNAAAPSVLIAYGKTCSSWLSSTTLDGHFVQMEGKVP